MQYTSSLNIIWQMQVQDKFDDTKWIIRKRKSKEAKEKKDMIYTPNKKRTKQQQQKSSTCDTRQFTIAKSPMTSYEWGTDEIVITLNGAYIRDQCGTFHNGFLKWRP